jgi:hypothetical protein
MARLLDTTQVQDIVRFESDDEAEDLAVEAQACREVAHVKDDVAGSRDVERGVE